MKRKLHLTFIKTIIGLLVINGYCFAQFENIRISDFRSTDPEEVTIAINPLNPNVMAAGANISYYYTSTDGGKRWKQNNLTSTLGVWGDPSVIFDKSGNLYFAHLSYPDEGYWIDRIVIQKSTDNGYTWSDGSWVGYNFPSGATRPKYQDKEWLAADLTNSDYQDNIYISWTEFDHYNSSDPEDSSRIMFARSTNFGLSWTPPLVISDTGGDCRDSDNTVEGAVPAVGPEGQVYVSWSGPLGIMFDKSTDGGKTFGKDIFVDEHPGGWDFDIPGISRCNGMPVTACDVSESDYRGNVYILWSDQRNGEDNTDIFFSRSEDEGETWSDPLRVNDDTTDRHQFFCWMAVDSSNGNIYAIFYDRRNTSGVATEVYMARSTDGGESFTNYKISESEFIPQANVFFGDYTNIAAYKGKIRPIWMRMDNGDLSVWTASINDNSLTDIDNGTLVPVYEYQLSPNYPNPFNPSTKIVYKIPRSGNVELKIYSLAGGEITELVNDYRNAGTHEVEFNVNDLNVELSSGIYIYKIVSGSYRASRKMLLLK